MMKRDSTDPSLKRAREPHTKMNFMSNFAAIESIEYQLNQGRFELKKQIPVKSLFYLIEGGRNLSSEFKIHWLCPFLAGNTG
jgi:hypothetical protein